MKTLTITLAAALLGSAALAPNASAQWPRSGGYTEVVIERGARSDRGNYYDREYDHRDGDGWRGRNDDWRGGRRARIGFEIERLYREVLDVREEIRNAGGGGRRMRAQFHRVIRPTEILRERYRRGQISGWEAQEMVEDLRADLWRVRRELRVRSRDPRVF
jgi:hypothetical protein